MGLMQFISIRIYLIKVELYIVWSCVLNINERITLNNCVSILVLSVSAAV